MMKLDCCVEYLRGRAGKRMKIILTSIIILSAFLCAPIFFHAKVTSSQTKEIKDYGKLPLVFEPNQGQTDPRAKFICRGSGYSLFLCPDEAVLVLKKPVKAKSGKPDSKMVLGEVMDNEAPEVLRVKLAGCKEQSQMQGQDQLGGISNYFVGNDASKWQTNIPQYAKVKINEIYPGIDLVYYGNQRQLEHDFVVKPGADPRAIRMNFEGAESLRIDSQGNLVLKVKKGEVVLEKPIVYQEGDSGRKVLDGRYVLVGNQQAGFEIGAYDQSKELVIDPVLVYSTYLGGSNNDGGNGIAVDGAGNAYVTGQTWSANFPTLNAIQGSLIGTMNVFVTKINAAGSAYIYSTYLGGSGGDYGTSIAVDNSGNAYITGYAASTNFPTFNAIQGTLGGSSDAFVSKINAVGNALVYSTYLGGINLDEGTGIAVDSLGNAYVTGSTQSTNFPTLNPIQGNLGGVEDAFVAKINAAGSALVYSTYLGGNNFDVGYGIAVDSSGNAYVTGYTQSTNFPTLNAIQGSLVGVDNAFVAKINATGSALVYSTYLGGSGYDGGTGIAVDSSGNAYVAGFTQSTNFPTLNPIQGNLGGTEDAFVTKINAAGNALVYSTYLGGSGADVGAGIAVDSLGDAFITGFTQSNNFPTFNTIQVILLGSQNAFVTGINAIGTGYVFSTYLGGGGDQGNGIALDSMENVYVTGQTTSTNFPTLNPIQGTNGGSVDAFVSMIGNMIVTPTTTATPSPTYTMGSSATSTNTSTATQTPSLTLTPLMTNTPIVGPPGPFPSPTLTPLAPNGKVSIGPSIIYPIKGDKCKITYQMDNDGLITIKIISRNGRIVETLEDSSYETAGNYMIEWDGKDNGNYLPSGIYYIVVETQTYKKILQVMIIK